MSIYCMSDPFDHIVNSCRLRFNDTIMLAVVILNKVEYVTANEIDDSKI